MNTPRIDGHTRVIAHLGHPTHSFKAPLIYNPWFAASGTNAVVVPFDCPADALESLLPPLMAAPNVLGALITMPHKVGVLALLDEVSRTAQVAGACNAVKRTANGRLIGDMFDGEGFVRGVQRKGRSFAGARVLVSGAGGVGSAIAASLASAGVARLALFDTNGPASAALSERLRAAYPLLPVSTGERDPAGFDLVVNATPLGMEPGDPLPLDVGRLDARSFVGEVVMRERFTAFLAAAQARGCRVQVGTDMLFEQIPAYLEFFGLPVATPERLRELAQLDGPPPSPQEAKP
ncbi:MAG TPA: shikimate dehydrogenase [Hydrogenophaga sp.]|uniref:shikimate dehydrogenase family protein n=1 Tax=Hydrogenophaga sp. TaxID=1904254 RepID=UPI002C841DF6|nr:shikimate dehydrogenase [Hydrogenophaga sp.]HSX93126.1 shikimate dehydrogenase [Hydrogenophaga sp.]